MNYRTLMAVALLAAFAAVAQAQITIPTTYSVTGQQPYDLGTLGGDQSEALDINDGGDIVGWAQDGANKKRAFIRLVELGYPLALDDGTVSFISARATGISNNRVVVGSFFAYDWLGGPYDHGFYYYPGIWMSEIWNDGFGLGLPWTTQPLAINNPEYIVGRGKVPGAYVPPNTTGVCYTDWVPLFWDGAGQDPFGLNCYPDPDNNHVGYLGVMPGAKDINDSNWIVGADGGHSTLAMFLRKGQFAIDNTPVPKPSGSPNGLFGSANGINNAGKVVGAYGYSASGSSTPDLRAFFWDAITSSSTPIGMLSGGSWSVANEINDQDMVVGTSDRNFALGGAGESAYIFHINFGMVRLKAPGEGLLNSGIKNCQANSLNNRKSNGVVEVVGSCLFGAVRHAVLWQVTVVKKAVIF